jgi:hypothetical protein
LNPSFTGSSNVGPFESRPTEFPRDFYDVNESGTEDPFARSVITVNEGEVVDGVNLVANEFVNRLDLLSDDDEILYLFPEGFTFPYFGDVHDRVVVNSDGNLTFNLGDGKVGEARTESRFLSGPPRIAPLFTDLDPSAGGEVRAETGEGFVKFIWDGVPEFDDLTQGSSNRFSVTLFATGDISFAFQEIDLTADPSQEYPQGLLAVVGISPGGLQSGSWEDLSAGSSTFALDSGPLYQVFPGNTFDLSDRTILLQSSGSRLFLPFYSAGNLSGKLQDVQQYTGFAITNYGQQSNDVLLEGRGSEGVLFSSPTNPGLRRVEPDTQVATLGNEVFGVAASAVQEGWVLLRSEHPELTAFFMTGNGLGGPLTKMDGAIALSRQATELYFTRLYQGNAVFATNSGLKPARTVLAIANPNDEAIRVTFRRYAGDGVLTATAVRNLEPLGTVMESLFELFGSQQPIADGYVSAEVHGPGAVGFELIELEDTLFSLNAASANPGTESYSAQLANGRNIFTDLKLVNPCDSMKSVTLKAFLLQDGTVNTIMKPVILQARQSLQQSVQSLFDLPEDGELVVGSIKVESQSAGIIGDVVFGDPHSAEYAAALSLETTPFRRAIFSQVSNGSSPAEPSLNSYTGLAFLNPNAAEARIEVKVFDRDGNLVGENLLVLGPWRRVSKLLEDPELIPASRELVRGYVMIHSDKPVVAQQVFGNFTLQYLAAVPPKILE